MGVVFCVVSRDWRRLNCWPKEISHRPAPRRAIWQRSEITCGRSAQLLRGRSGFMDIGAMRLAHEEDRETLDLAEFGGAEHLVIHAGVRASTSRQRDWRCG